MSSIFINAPSSSSSMKCIYPPSCNKPSKQELKHGNCNPTRNKRTHPFVLRSSSHSLCLGCRCRHCGSLHSQVLFCLTFHTLWSIALWLYCFPWTQFNLWFCVQHLCVILVQRLCVVFVFSMTLVCGFLSHSCNFGCFSSCLCCIWIIYVSLLCIFHVGMRNWLWYAYKLFVEMPQWV